MKFRPYAAIFLLVLLTAACQEAPANMEVDPSSFGSDSGVVEVAEASATDPPSLGSDTVPTVRKWAAVELDTLWSVSAGQEPEPFAEISDLAADGELIYLTDPIHRRVTALRGSDGAVVWYFGSRGSGPGQFERPAFLGVIPGGGVAATDLDTWRLTVVNRSGHLAGIVQLPRGAQVDGLCAVNRNQYLLAMDNGLASLHWSDSTGAAIPLQPLPWPELSRLESMLLAAKVAAVPGSADCVVALSFANRLARVSPAGVTATGVSVETASVPGVVVETTVTRVNEFDTRTTISSRYDRSTVEGPIELSVSGGVLNVLYAGRSGEALKIVDRYDVSTLRYLSSIQLPFRAVGMTWLDDSTIILAHEDFGTPVLTALRITARGP